MLSLVTSGEKALIHTLYMCVLQEDISSGQLRSRRRLQRPLSFVFPSTIMFYPWTVVGLWYYSLMGTRWWQQRRCLMVGGEGKLSGDTRQVTHSGRRLQIERVSVLIWVLFAMCERRGIGGVISTTVIRLRLISRRHGGF